MTDPLDELAKAPACIKGVDGHRWVLSLHEGSLDLRLAEGEVCPGTCESAVTADSVEMDDVPVRLAYRPEHPTVGNTWHGDTPCDCGWWWDVTLEEADGTLVERLRAILTEAVAWIDRRDKSDVSQSAWLADARSALHPQEQSDE